MSDPITRDERARWRAWLADEDFGPVAEALLARADDLLAALDAADALASAAQPALWELDWALKTLVANHGWTHMEDELAAADRLRAAYAASPTVGSGHSAGAERSPQDVSGPHGGAA